MSYENLTADEIISNLERRKLGWSLDHTGNLIEARIWLWPNVVGRYRPYRVEPLAEMLRGALRNMKERHQGRKELERLHGSHAFLPNAMESDTPRTDKIEQNLYEARPSEWTVEQTRIAHARELERENTRLREWIMQQYSARRDGDGRWIDGNGEHLDILDSDSA